MQIKASALLPIFWQMLLEHWTYEWGAARKGCVDCSGAFVYAYKLLGGDMYHGSNTMYREWSKKRGRISEIDLVPGKTVYKVKPWTNSEEDRANRWYGSEPGNVYHTGLYAGNGIVLEAKGTKDGFVQSRLSEWTHASDLINTIYDVKEGEEIMTEPVIGQGIVETESGDLNMRTAPSTSTPPLPKKIPKGATVDLLSDAQNGWYRVRYNGAEGYCSAAYITPIDGGDGTKSDMVRVPRALLLQLAAYLN